MKGGSLALIELDNVGIKFSVLKRKKKKKISVNPISLLLGRNLVKDRFWALKDISFKLEDGDNLALIGHNGAGKSTLCSVLSGIMVPDRGHIAINARVAPILSLGAGFNRQLSGRDNIKVCATLMGMKQSRIPDVIDEVTDFAELEDFIENPINTYSAGMKARLAFGLATSVDAEVLILDETLSVGDDNFKERAVERMNQLRERARAVVLVSHSRETLEQMCNKALLLDHGRNCGQGPVAEMLEKYDQVVKEHQDKRRRETEARQHGEGMEV